LGFKSDCTGLGIGTPKKIRNCNGMRKTPILASHTRLSLKYIYKCVGKIAINKAITPKRHSGTAQEYTRQWPE
jgi:hypothetical protein